MEVPQMIPCGFCIWAISFQCVHFNGTPKQMHRDAYFKRHQRLGEMQKTVDGRYETELRAEEGKTLPFLIFRFQ